jgi:hypothetical protein
MGKKEAGKIDPSQALLSPETGLWAHFSHCILTLERPPRDRKRRRGEHVKFAFAALC